MEQLSNKNISLQMLGRFVKIILKTYTVAVCLFGQCYMILSAEANKKKSNANY